MIDRKLTLTVSFALACCFGLVLLPISAGAETVGGVVHGAKRGVEKGARAVQQGTETGIEKAKEGAEAVGHGTKKLFTGKDNNQSNARMKTTESQSECNFNRNRN
jgi:hypothetical protein